MKSSLYENEHIESPHTTLPSVYSNEVRFIDMFNGALVIGLILGFCLVVWFIVLRWLNVL